MGYFDALTSSYFKTAPDGRKLFFPWGVMGKGYVLASEADYQRLRRQCTIYTMVGFLLVLVPIVTLGFQWAVIPAVLVIAFYFFWMRSVLRGLQPTNESLSLKESMTSQAQAHSGWVLWLLTVCSLAFVIGGIAMIITEPSERLMGLAATAFFGVCLIAFVRMLVLRRRGAAAKS